MYLHEIMRGCIIIPPVDWKTENNKYFIIRFRVTFIFVYQKALIQTFHTKFFTTPL